MENNPIGKHLKKIVDDLVEKHGVEYCISRALKLNGMNKRLLEGHIAEGNISSAAGVQKNIDANNKASVYLNELLKEKTK